VQNHQSAVGQFQAMGRHESPGPEESGNVQLIQPEQTWLNPFKKTVSIID
jgi:hypothetical protein